MRLFLAIHPRAEEVARLQELQMTVRRALESRLPRVEEQMRWTRPGQFHLTIEFLGEVEPSLLEQLRTEFAAAARMAESVRVVIDGLGAFPVYRPPQVLWFRVRREAGLGELQRLTRLLLVERGFSFETAQFPHLTAGRLRKVRMGGDEIRIFGGMLDRFCEEWADGVVEWTVDRMMLMESHPARGGVEYGCLEEYVLGGVAR